MIGPTWLAAIFGVIMLVAAVVALVRIIVAWRTHRPTDYEVDIHNVLMGVSMAGMLIPPLLIVTPGPSNTVWLIVWIAVTVWFAISVARHPGHGATGTRFTRHHVPHLVMSAAMVYMFAVMTSPAIGGHSGMSTMSGGATVPWPTLDYAFALFMVGYAVLVVDRLPALAKVGVPGRASDTKPLAPTTAAATNIVMAVTMGYMLAMMFV
jgi:hypothetical protein